MDLDESLQEIAVFLVFLGNRKEVLLVDELVFVKERIWDYGHVEFLLLLIVILLILIIIFMMDLQET